MVIDVRRRERVAVLGVDIDRITMAQAVQQCMQFIAAGIPRLVVTPNAEIIQRAARDRQLAAVLRAADLVVPDGAGVVLAAGLLGRPLPEKVAGVDLADGLLKSVPPGTRIFLLGAAPGVAAAAAKNLAARHPGIVMAGWHHGFWPHFDPVADAGVIRQIREAAPAVLFAGLGAPMQEKWLCAHLEALGVPVAMGIGGGIDLWAGRARRAPVWMINANLEWLYRIVKFGRYGRSLPPLVAFSVRVLTAAAIGWRRGSTRR